jgi:membrane associated rhomboid family serine protease
MVWHPTWNEEPPKRTKPMFFGRGTTPPGVLLVLMATVAVFILDALSRGRLTAAGALTVNSLLRLELWRLVTYQFLHAGFTHIFWNMFILWMLGVTLERQLGTRQFLLLYLVSGVAGGLFEAGFNGVMQLQFGLKFHQLTGETFLNLRALGASAGVAGVLVAFAVINPRAIFLLFFLIPIEARWIAVGYVAIETFAMFQGLRGMVDNVAHAAHLGGMVMGYVWIRYGGALARQWSRRQRRPETGYFDRSPEREAEDEAEVDRILQKIHDDGLDSLTVREKLFLQEMSRRRGRR